MPTVMYNSASFECAKAVKGSDYIELYNADGVATCRFGGVTDFTAFTISDGSWTEPAGACSTRAASAKLTSGNIVLTLDEEVGNNSLVTFKAPCDCSSVTGGLVAGGVTYTIVNSVGRDVTGIGGVFCSDAVLSVLLDKSNRKAYLLSGPANITWGTEDLVAGTSTLPTGQLYLVYE